MVTVELFGLPRLRGGASRVEVPAGSLGEVLRAVADRLPGLVPDVLRDGRPTEHALVALDGREFLDDPALPVEDGSVLVLISAQAGG